MNTVTATSPEARLPQATPTREGEETRHQFEHTMEALARFSGGIAHDLNNVLTTIFGYTDFLLERVHKQGPLYAQLNEIKQASLRAAELTRLLMMFGAQRVFQPVVMNINAVISTCAPRLAAAAGARVRVALRLCEERCLAAIEPYEFEEALVRLAENAREAMPDGGTLTIATGITDGSAAKVFVRLVDDGPGFSDDALQHVFEPFYSTKHETRKQGIGLFTVYVVMRQCGGTVTCRNAPGGGAEITLTLPRVCAPPTAAPPARAVAPVAAHAGATLLLVEDDQQVRALLKEALTLKGFSVLEAEDGLTALKIFEQDTARINVILTDVALPEMNGRELGKRAQALRPDINIIYMSGYSDNEELRAEVLQQKSVFIQKPFTPQQLVQKLREVLGG